MEFKHVKAGEFQPAEVQAWCELAADVFTAAEGEAEAALVRVLMKELLQSPEHALPEVFCAQQGSSCLGLVLFTPLRLNNQTASDMQMWLLSPMAVGTEFQGCGIGQQLIRFALDILQTQGADWVFTYGDPAFYGKSGFKPAPDWAKAPYPLSYPHGWQCVQLSATPAPQTPQVCQCVAPFAHAEYW